MRLFFNMLFLLFILSSEILFSQATFIRMELDVKKMLNPSCNLNMGVVDSNRIYVHLGLCTCHEQAPFGPETRNCTDATQNELFCTTQITPFQSRVWQHVVGNWGTTPQDDGVGLMTYEGDSIWSLEFIVEDYFSDLSLVQDTAFGNDSSIAFQSGLIPYTIGVVFRSKDGFYSGRDNGCNDIFITGLQSGNPQVIQSTDLSVYEAITLNMNILSVDEINDIRSVKIYPNPITNHASIRFSLQNHEKNVEVNIYNIIGKRVFQLFNGEMHSGNHELRWDGMLNKKELASGSYFLEIKTKTSSVNKKIIIN